MPKRLKNRTVCGDAIKTTTFQTFSDICKDIKRPRSRILDEIIEDWIDKNYPEYKQKEQ